jgi:NADH-quinone oxidoreductase subunit F
MAGGVAGGRKLQAILLGGAAGVFVRPDELDMPLTFEGARAAQATLGSGVIMVFDDTIDMMDIILRVAAFFRDESLRPVRALPGGNRSARRKRSTGSSRPRLLVEQPGSWHCSRRSALR